MSRNYRLIVTSRKFDVLKTNMLVLRTSNFQGATIRPIVPRHKDSIVFIVHHQIFFRLLVQKSLQLNYFQDFETKAVKPNIKLKRKQTKTLNTISAVYFLRNPLVYRKIFTDGHYPSGHFPRTGTMHSGIFGGLALYKQWSPFGARICSDICPRTLSVPRSEQFSESEARGKL